MSSKQYCNQINSINVILKKEINMSNLTYIILQSIVLIVYGSYVINKYIKRKALKALIKPIQIVSHSPIVVSIDNAKQQ